MSHPRSGAVRQPANDLVAFDISKQAPEEIARLFGRWKEQRKRLQGDNPPARPPKSASTRFMPVIIRSSSPADVPPPPLPAEPPSQPDAIQSGAIRYSASFANLLATGEKVPVAQQLMAFALTPARRIPQLAVRRARLRWVLTGVVSLLAVAAASAAVLWQSSAPQQGDVTLVQSMPSAHSSTARADRAPVEVAPASMELQITARFLPIAVQPPRQRAEWQLALEIALLRPTPAEVPAESDVSLAHVSPMLKPNAAAKTTGESASAPTPQIVNWTGARPRDEEVSLAAPPEPAPAPASTPQQHPDTLYKRGNDKIAGGDIGRAAPAGKGHINNGSSGPSAGAKGSPGGATSGGSGASGSSGNSPGDSGGTGGSPGSGSGASSGTGSSSGSGSGAGGASSSGDAGGSPGGSSSGASPGSGSSSGSSSGTSGSGDAGSGSGTSPGTGSGDGSSASSGESGESGDDGSSSSKPDKPKKGDVDVHGSVSIGGGGIGASVGGHIGGIGGGVSAGIGH